MPLDLRGAELKPVSVIFILRYIYCHGNDGASRSKGTQGSSPNPVQRVRVKIEIFVREDKIRCIRKAKKKKEVVIENVNFERQCPVLMNSSFPLLEVFRTFHNIFVKKTKQNTILFVFEVQNRVCRVKKNK